jgi:16S rRNA (adenine1518-N6/adenine1519-N6)-dimethyltransferase
MNPWFRPLKRFGQNFLTDKNIIRKMLLAAELSKEDSILEIGPGRGALTFEMAKKVRRLIAIEVDFGLCELLRERACDLKNLDVICADILKFDLKNYIKKNKIRSLKVVANLPYYITTPSIEFFLKNIVSIRDIFITVQREVAERIVAPVGSKAYGSLSCFIRYHCRPVLLFKIKAGSFWPTPKVESSFVRLVPIANRKKIFGVKSEELLFKVIRSAFGQRRKRLYASLAGILGRKDLDQLLAEALLSRRPQELDLTDFVTISNLIFDFLEKR